MKAAGIVDFGTDLQNPNFAKMAEAVGLLGLTAETPDQVRPMLSQALQHNGPALVEIPVSRQELSMPPTITLEQMKGFSLFALKAILSGTVMKSWTSQRSICFARVVNEGLQENGMEKPISGIHHVTAIASDPQRNLDFYTQVLGLRLVKRTVNFDDPGTYHFYFADEVGSPGTILTFFPWPGSARGKQGTGQVTVTSFSIPERSAKFWEDRLGKAGVAVEKSGKRLGEEVLTIGDPDGLKVELIASPWANAVHAWSGSDIAAEHGVRGFHSVTLSEQGYERTSKVLETMGFRKVAEEGNRFRFEVGKGGSGARADVLCASEAPRGRIGAGTVHHVAWRVDDDDSEKSWRHHLAENGLDVTPVMDRCYFHSIYFREPGGVLFEVATDPPGFATDEPVESLGESLRLPVWLERYRGEIEKALPPVEVHYSGKDRQSGKSAS